MRTAKEERKLSIYFPRGMVREISRVADKLKRPRSWVLQQAWDMTKQMVVNRVPLYKERWKNDFVEVVSSISGRTASYSESEIEAFAVRAAKNSRHHS